MSKHDMIFEAKKYLRNTNSDIGGEKHARKYHFRMYFL